MLNQVAKHIFFALFEEILIHRSIIGQTFRINFDTIYCIFSHISGHYMHRIKSVNVSLQYMFKMILSHITETQLVYCIQT